MDFHNPWHWLAALAIYFLPTIACPRGERFGVFIINLTLGWTFIGWLWAISEATAAVRRRTERLYSIRYRG